MNLLVKDDKSVNWIKYFLKSFLAQAKRESLGLVMYGKLIRNSNRDNKWFRNRSKNGIENYKTKQKNPELVFFTTIIINTFYNILTNSNFEILYNLKCFLVLF